jgi:hypothetical protein
MEAATDWKAAYDTTTYNRREANCNACAHAYRQGELMHRVEERDFYFSAAQVDQIQGAIAKEAMVSDGILCGDAYNRGALAARTKANALLQRLQCMGR